LTFFSILRMQGCPMAYDKVQAVQEFRRWSENYDR